MTGAMLIYAEWYGAHRSNDTDNVYGCDELQTCRHEGIQTVSDCQMPLQHVC